MPARNAPSAIETPKHDGRARGDGEGQDQHGQREQLARPRRGDLAQQPGMTSRPPTTTISADEHATLTQRRARQARRDALAVAAAAPPHAPASAGQQHQHEDGEDVLDDQPADGDVALRRVRARRCPSARGSARPCWPRRSPCRAPGPADQPQPERQADDRARERWRRGSGRPRPGTAMRRTASRSSRWKCRPTPNISRMTPISASCGGEVRVGDEARRVRADATPGQQVADDRRQAQPLGDQPQARGPGQG